MLASIYNSCNLHTVQSLNESHRCCKKYFVLQRVLHFTYLFFVISDKRVHVSAKRSSKYVDENIYPGIPRTPRPRDGGRSPMSGKRYGFCLKNESSVFGSIIV